MVKLIQMRPGLMNKKISILIIIFFSSLFFFSFVVNAAEVVIDTFSLTPNVVPTTSGGRTQFRMTLSGKVNVAEFNSRCGSSVNKFAWYVYAGAGEKKSSGEQNINRTQAVLPFNINQNIIVSLSAPELRGGTFNYYAAVYCSTSLLSPKLTESSRIPIIFGTSTDKAWACVAANNKYACSPGSFTNCSDVSACSGRRCIEIGKNLCGQDAGTGGGGGGGTGGGGGGGSGQDLEVSFNIKNPIQSESLIDLAKAIGRFLFQIGIPIAVVVIIYSGILFLTSRGDKEKITKARQALWYAVIGLAIILIGQGFFTLIKSILNLGG